MKYSTIKRKVNNTVNEFEKATYLPNPDAERKPCVEACDGCNRRYERTTILEEGMIPQIEDVCISYIDTAVKHRLGCPMKSNKESEKSDKKKVNPLKMSKRIRRRGF